MSERETPGGPDPASIPSTEKPDNLKDKDRNDLIPVASQARNAVSGTPYRPPRKIFVSAAVTQPIRTAPFSASQRPGVPSAPGAPRVSAPPKVSGSQPGVIITDAPVGPPAQEFPEALDLDNPPPLPAAPRISTSAPAAARPSPVPSAAVTQPIRPSLRPTADRVRLHPQLEVYEEGGDGTSENPALIVAKDVILARMGEKAWALRHLGIAHIPAPERDERPGIEKITVYNGKSPQVIYFRLMSLMRRPLA